MLVEILIGTTFCSVGAILNDWDGEDLLHLWSKNIFLYPFYQHVTPMG